MNREELKGSIKVHVNIDTTDEDRREIPIEDTTEIPFKVKKDNHDMVTKVVTLNEEDILEALIDQDKEYFSSISDTLCNRMLLSNFIVVNTFENVLCSQVVAISLAFTHWYINEEGKSQTEDIDDPFDFIDDNLSEDDDYGIEDEWDEDDFNLSNYTIDEYRLVSHPSNRNKALVIKGFNDDFYKDEVEDPDNIREIVANETSLSKEELEEEWFIIYQDNEKNVVLLPPEGKEGVMKPVTFVGLWNRYFKHEYGV